MEGRSDIESPGSGFQQSQYTFDKGSLSTTVGTDDTQKITFVDSQVYIMQYGPVIVSGAEVLYLYDGGCRHSFFFVKWTESSFTLLQALWPYSSSPPPSRMRGD